MTLEGMDRTLRALQAVPQVARTHAADALQLSAYAVAKRASDLVPVASGELKRAITHETSEVSLVGRVGLASSPANRYWYFVEFGTVNMSARPFFRPAAEMERNAFIRRMQQIGPMMELDLGRSF